MKKNILWLGILALALVFGMTLVGCGGDDDPSGNSAKKITITGYTPPGDGDIMIALFASPADYLKEDPDFAAVGLGIVSGNSVTFTLVKDMFGTPFTGTGSYYIEMQYDEFGGDDPDMPGESDGEYEDSIYYTYLYTNGQTVEALDIANPHDIAKAPKFTISSDTSTIAFAKFQDVTDIWWIEEFEDGDDDDDDGDDVWANPNLDPALFGSWVYTMGGNGISVIHLTLTFYNDGTYTYSSDSGTVKTPSGSWSTSGGNLTLNGEESTYYFTGGNLYVLDIGPWVKQ